MGLKPSASDTALPGHVFMTRHARVDIEVVEMRARESSEDHRYFRACLRDTYSRPERVLYIESKMWDQNAVGFEEAKQEAWTELSGLVGHAFLRLNYPDAMPPTEEVGEA